MFFLCFIFNWYFCVFIFIFLILLSSLLSVYLYLLNWKKISKWKKNLSCKYCNIVYIICMLYLYLIYDFVYITWFLKRYFCVCELRVWMCTCVIFFYVCCVFVHLQRRHCARTTVRVRVRNNNKCCITLPLFPIYPPKAFCSVC